MEFPTTTRHPLSIRHTPLTHDGEHIQHVHRYEPTVNGIGDVIGRRCACGLYQSGPDPRWALYAGFTSDES